MAADDRRIGNVVQVAADRLVIELRGQRETFTVVGFDDIHYVARIGGFVLVPTGPDYVVCEIVGVRERDQPQPRGSRTTTELNKAQSIRFLDVVPVGTLPQDRDGEFRFGVSAFPSLYSDVLYCRHHDLDRIFDVAVREEPAAAQQEPSAGSEPTRLRTLTVGTSVVFDGFDVKAKIDEFFGGHIAVLGNTGSGKSCTVASLIQSLFEKTSPHPARGATFLLLDVNGEYSRSLTRLPDPIEVRSLTVPHTEAPQKTPTFRLPHWFMSVEEWELLLRASERTQQPVLRTALGLVSLFSSEAAESYTELKNHILARCLQNILESELGSAAKTDRINGLLTSFNTDELKLSIVRPMIRIEFGGMKDSEGLASLIEEHVRDQVSMPKYDHTPFEFSALGDALDLALLYEEAHGNRQIRDYCSQMVTRYNWIREREEFAFLRHSVNELRDFEKGTSSFVEHLLGLERRDKALFKESQVVVLDLNEAEDEVVEVVAAVVARLVFDRLRRADPRNRLPVNMLLEEAHRYISARSSRFAIDAGRIFERIAKEGRKYGVFLIVASQRPSELSKTVLSQCSNFVIHRIQNPEDLSHIRQMTPFISESVLSRLPSLPKQHALLFGNAVNIPSTFRVRDVEPKPKSDDAPISELWFQSESQPAGLS